MATELSQSSWQQGTSLELDITDLSDRGDGVGRWHGQRVVFVPDTVTGDRVRARLVRVKRNFAHAKLQAVLVPSTHRQRARCIVADKCGGCQWQHVTDAYQQTAKQDLVRQALQRLGGFEDPPLEPLLTASDSLSYRNKASYPLGRSRSGQVQAGYYRKGSHQLVNLNRCPIQDMRLDPLLAAVKQDIQAQNWSIYNEHQHHGKLRHLSLRIGRHTGETLLTLIATTANIPNLEAVAQQWLEHHPQLVGVALNLNADRTNAIFGTHTHTIAGRSYLEERFADLRVHLRPETFFQVNTEAAEALYRDIEQHLQLQGSETLVDAYCGIGTFTLPLARRLHQAIGIEVQASAVKQARENAALNGITNVEFQTGSVAVLLPRLEIAPDIVLLDPPRKGCDRPVLETLIQQAPARIVYISCKPATLARDLKILCASGRYRLERARPADFFPQTAHVECVAFLNRIET
ncbi:MAG: 23S rRNA (uracil(1939)-C(5))-methyltransferase RlmD [Cyanobacteria bacterium J06641_5]